MMVRISECCHSLPLKKDMGGRKVITDMCSKCKKNAKFYIDFWKDDVDE